MLDALTDADEIAKAQAELRENFVAGAKLLPVLKVRGRNGVYWHETLRIWGSLSKGPENRFKDRYFNAFGSEDPMVLAPANQLYSLEVNPARGIDPNCAGLFARDGGQVYLLHKGRFYGMTMEAFWSEYDDGGGEFVSEIGDKPYAIVARIGLPTMVKDIERFVNEVRRVKLVLAGA